LCALFLAFPLHFFPLQEMYCVGVWRWTHNVDRNTPLLSRALLCPALGTQAVTLVVFNLAALKVGYNDYNTLESPCISLATRICTFRPLTAPEREEQKGKK
jgi:hypothetical protein